MFVLRCCSGSLGVGVVIGGAELVSVLVVCDWYGTVAGVDVGVGMWW